MAKQRTVRAFSAGGVVFRYPPRPMDLQASQASSTANQTRLSPADSLDTIDVQDTTPIEVVLVGRPWENFWVLPKGTPEQGETKEQVALREVAEESGVRGRILDELGSIHYWFSRRGVRYSKEVLYYLMEAVGGDVSLHDAEYDDARWFALEEAAATLTYRNEADLVRRARSFILRHTEQQVPSERQ